MSIERALKKRSENSCELCGNKEALSVFEVSPAASEDKAVYLCGICVGHLNDSDSKEVNHWRCLNESMWSTVPAVQIMAYRQLDALSKRGEAWAQDLLEMLYLDEYMMEWAQEGIEEIDEDAPVHVDSNGVVLQAGDTVTLIKDLDVKGSSLTAKRGTAVRNIGLSSNPEHIEGRVDGQRIVILTKFVKK